MVLWLDAQNYGIQANTSYSDSSMYKYLIPDVLPIKW
jgi:hypothetical protein